MQMVTKQLTVLQIYGTLALKVMAGKRAELCNFGKLCSERKV